MSSILPQAIDTSKTYIGPELSEDEKKPSRKQYTLYNNETISIEDRVHGLQIITKTSQESNTTKDPLLFIAKYKEMIEDHLERRVAIAFQQFVVSYKTKLHFEIGDTRHQGQSSKAITHTDHNNKSSKLTQRNAAHSSTLPCIIAYNGQDWEDHIKNESPAPKGFIYINGSNIYKSANSTLSMPRDVNEADIEIDGKAESERLRSKTILILNQCSQGKLDPKQAFKLFLQATQTETQKQMGKSKKDTINEVLKIFNQTLEGIESNLPNPDFFERMLGIQIGNSKNSILARKTICELRYKAIQDNQLAQSEIVSKIEALTQDVFKSLNQKRKPNYLDKAVFNVLRKQLRPKDQRSLDKLVSSAQNYHFRETQQRTSGLNKTSRLVEEHALKTIQDYAESLHETLFEIRRDNVLKRGQTVRVLRNSLGWTQKVLSSKLITQFEGAAASQSTLSRIENNIKLINSMYAKQLATVFDIDPELLIPCFFES